MSINDPILEALSFALENDLTTCPSTSGGTSGANCPTPQSAFSISCETTSEPPADLQSAFVPSSKLLEEDSLTPCIFRECSYVSQKSICRDKKSHEEILAHFLSTHNLVIDSVHEIANLAKYLDYWKERFKEGNVKDFCVGFSMNESKGMTSAPGSDNLYYMLSTALPEDARLRKEIWSKRLELVLEVNRQEREDSSFSRRCLFCRDTLTGNRSQYFSHMRDSHSFHIGLPDNLVFVSELVHLIEQKLNQLECLFCEHIFKDKAVLKEHMRKKQHRKINPKNVDYDRFYVVNYLEPGKTWETIELEDAEEERKEEDWIEPLDKKNNIVCLFCPQAEVTFDSVLTHMETSHRFHFSAITASFDFYQKVKLTNYIRRSVYKKSCFCCEASFEKGPLLLQHIYDHEFKDSGALKSASQWNQPEYLLPTYESDEFLTFLEDTQETDAQSTCSEDDRNVIPEDYPKIDINREFDLAGYAIKYHQSTP